MNRYLKEILALTLQILLFYLFPLSAGPSDTMGMVVLIILGTLILSIIIGSISNNKIKCLYPVITALIFIPSIFIYYNDSALIHLVWYLVIGYIGLGIGCLINKFIKKTELKKD